MAEEQKPVEVPQEETLAAPVEIKPIEVTPAAVAAPAEDKPAEETKVDAEETVDAADAKDKVTPVEEGQLSHKAQGLSFPKYASRSARITRKPSLICTSQELDPQQGVLLLRQRSYGAPQPGQLPQGREVR